MTRRLVPLPTLQARLAVGFAERTGASPADAARMATAVMQDMASPVAEAIQAAWRAVVDNVLFDTPLEPVRPGEEATSTAIYGLVLDTAAELLTGWAAALEMAHAHNRPATPPAAAEVIPLDPHGAPEASRRLAAAG